MTFSNLVYDIDMWVESLDYIDYVLILLGFIVIFSSVAIVLEMRRSKDQ